MEQIATLLKHHAFFAPLSMQALKKLAHSAEVIRVGAGARLYTQNAPADSAFLILNGSVNLVDEHDGKNDIIQYLNSGTVLSHLSLLTQTSRLTSAYAHTSLEVAKITRADFSKILREHPQDAIGLRTHLMSVLGLAETERRALIEQLEAGL